MHFRLILVLFILSRIVIAQFHPSAGLPGSSAIHKDSAVFVNWADRCSLIRGFKNIAVADSGYASVGDSTFATGAAGSNGVVSLGDGGVATLQFPFPVVNGPGYDFAVFENSFSDDYLELAFVEVSSDGINFFRFPATTLVQDSLQCGAFGLTDATKVNNLAGKYRVNYGTPFDLQELTGVPGLNTNAVTHVRIVDVVGSLDSIYATYDQNGKKINDPWPTSFPSSGFDLDAVGVINQQENIGWHEYENNFGWISVSHCETGLLLNFRNNNTQVSKLKIFDLNGSLMTVVDSFNSASAHNEIKVECRCLSNGVYFFQGYTTDGKQFVGKILFTE